MNRRIKMPVGKVVLYKLYNGKDWDYCSCGNIHPSEITVGQRVWVGSISSRDGYYTSDVVKVENVKRIPAVYFETENGSMYLVVSLKHHFATKEKEDDNYA